MTSASAVNWTPYGRAHTQWNQCIRAFVETIPPRHSVVNYYQQFLLLHVAVNSSTFVRHPFKQQIVVMHVSVNSLKAFLRDALSSSIISNLWFCMWPKPFLHDK